MQHFERLLRPQSLAVFGGASAEIVIRQCLGMGYAGKIWPVHPTKDEVAGLKAYRNVDDLPDVPDAAFIGVNRFMTVNIVRDLAAKGAGGAICYASGFLEAGADDMQGAQLQNALIEAAGTMPIIGPNCYGLINYADGALLWPDQHGGQRLKTGGRGAAIITQSSNIAINLTMQQRGLPISYVLTAGNQAQTGLSEIALGLIEDSRVSCLGLHIEGFDDIAGFERLAERARRLNKPIVAIKSGRSEQARAATISHTASIAGDDAAAEIFLKKLGIARVRSIPALLESLKLLHCYGPLGRHLSSMSCSGGEASVMADSVVGRQLYFPPLNAQHHDRIKATLEPLVTVANPLDYHTFIWNDEPALTATFAAMVSGGFDLNLLVLDFPRQDRCSDADWLPSVRAFEKALKVEQAKGAIVATLGENLPEAVASDLIERGIVPFSGIEEALDAVEAAAFIAEAWAYDGMRLSVYKPASDCTSDHSGAAQYIYDEADAKTLLSQAGLHIPQGQRVLMMDEVLHAAETLHFPVVLKALGIAHKSEMNAVRINLKSREELQHAAQELLLLGNALYIEQMVQGGVAEIIVGISRDPVFGPVMTIGTGGVLVELLQDSFTVLLPVDAAALEEGLRNLRFYPLLDGYRGRPKADIAALIDAIMKLSAFVLQHANLIEELDINPLIVCAQGQSVWVADALLVMRQSATGLLENNHVRCA